MRAEDAAFLVLVVFIFHGALIAYLWRRVHVLESWIRSIINAGYKKDDE
jgi:hypothetical protein